jgi:hypothetical protein
MYQLCYKINYSRYYIICIIVKRNTQTNLNTKKISIMKTIKDFKELLFNYEENTLLGMQLNYLFNEDHTANSTIHNLEEKIEVIAQLNENGINVFIDNYQVGNISKAFYQWNLKKYEDFK